MSSDITNPAFALHALDRVRQKELGKSPMGSQSEETQQAFESMLLKQLISVMRSTVSESGLLGSGSGGQMYDHLIEEAMTEQMVRSGGIGLRKLFQQPTVQDLQNPSHGPDTLDRKVGLTPRRAFKTSRAEGAASAALAAESPHSKEQWLESPAVEKALRQTLEQQANSIQLKTIKED